MLCAMADHHGRKQAKMVLPHAGAKSRAVSLLYFKSCGANLLPNMLFDGASYFA